MSVKSLSILNFRNIRDARLSPSPDFNFLIGNNGSGKSNLLESFYLFYSGKSFRKARFQDMLNYDSEFLRLSVAVENIQGSRFIYYERDGKPRYGFEGAEMKRSEFFPAFYPFVISREIFNLFYFGSSETRGFFDGYAGMFDPLYRRDLLRFNKILRERNALLKAGYTDADELHVWNHYFIEYAAVIEKRRLAFCNMVNEKIGSCFSWLFNDISDASIEYSPSLNGTDPTDFISEDMARGITTRGPHRDRFTLHIEGREMSMHASQGQMKSFVIAFVLGVAELLEKQKNCESIILLDDIFEELDNVRRNAVHEMLRISERQVFLTMVDSTQWAVSGDAVFRIEKGEIID